MIKCHLIEQRGEERRVRERERDQSFVDVHHAARTAVILITVLHLTFLSLVLKTVPFNIIPGV